jgi:ABC-type uncharacterized transport system ATPase subunit
VPKNFSDLNYIGGSDGEKHKHVQYIGYLPEERGLYNSMKVGEQCLWLK